MLFDIPTVYGSNPQGVDNKEYARASGFTGYRVLVILSASSFGLVKAVLAYQDHSTAPATLEWLLGVVVFLLSVVRINPTYVGSSFIRIKKVILDERI
jgi:hypothetical protein